MATNTTNFALRKPEGTDLVNVLADISDNFEKIDDLGDAWTAYAPSWGTSGAAPVLGNGTLSGRYRKIGKMLHFHIVLKFGTTTAPGTALAWRFTLPPGILTRNNGLYQHADVIVVDELAATRLGQYLMAPNANDHYAYWLSGDVLGNLAYNSPMTWGNLDYLVIQGFCETE